MHVVLLPVIDHAINYIKYIHAYIQTYTHIHTHTYIRTYIHTFIPKVTSVTEQQ